MAIVTHGTTLAGFKAIMARSGKIETDSPWTVSQDDGKMYFYHAESVGEAYGYEEPEYSVDAAANLSFEAGRLQYAVAGEGGQVVVLVCDIPDSSLELDYSCNGDCSVMSEARAMDCDEFDPAWIVEIRTCDFNVWDCPFILACAWDNSLFNKWVVPENLQKVVERVKEVHCESLYDFELESENVAEFIAQNA